MSEAVSHVANGQNHSQQLIQLKQLDRHPAHDTFDEIGTPSVEPNGTIGHASRVGNPRGFRLCEPNYNKEGKLPSKVDGHNRTEVDIIGIAAIGADSTTTWEAKTRYTHGSQSNKAITFEVKSHLWITRDIRRKIPSARILLYDGHEELQSGDRLLSLARKYLKCHHELREHEGEQRPFFLICHSTGGLVAKLALIEASRGSPDDKMLLADCFGVAFFATPHQGSSYLSSPEFTASITRAMRLKTPLPESVQSELQINHRLLHETASKFRPLAADLMIWTFYETEDTDLTIPETEETDQIPILAPIVSIRSAILELYHEIDYPMLTDHVGCASFSGENNEILEDFLSELKSATKQAWTLSKEKHIELKIKEKVEVEVHGFYKGLPQPSGSETPIRLWSIKKSLQEFIMLGPSKCLEERLTELSTPPVRGQFERSATKAQSLDNRLAGDISSAAMRIAARGSSSKEVPEPPRNGSLLENKPIVKGDSPSQDVRKSVKRIFGGKTGPGDASPPNLASSKPLNPENPTPSQKHFPLRPLTIPGIGTSDTTNKDVPPDVVVSTPGGDTHGPIQGPIEPQKATLPQIPFAIANASSAPANANSVAEERPIDSVASKPSLNLPSTSKAASHGLKPHAPPFVYAAPQGVPSMATSNPSGRRGSTGTSDMLPPTRFTKPDVASRKLTWIHVPFNNPSWVTNVLTTVSTEKGTKDHEKLLDMPTWGAKHMRSRRSEHQACYVKPGCQLLSLNASSASPSITPSRLKASDPVDLKLSLYMPYLHWDTYKLLVKRRHLVKKRLEHNRSRPVPEWVSRLDLEHRVTWVYLGRDPPFNCRRTLDQFGYPNLHDTRARDDDQMLYKMTKKRRKASSGVLISGKSDTSPQNIGSDGEHIDEDEESLNEEDQSSDEDVLDGTVLMVDQLWLWIVGNDTTITFFPRGGSKPTDGRLYQQADLRNSIYNEVNADLARRCENSLDLAALVASHAVTVLFENSSHTHLEVFRIFEESISILVEKMTKSFKDFRSLGFRDKSADYDSDNIIVSIKDKHKREGKLSEKQNRDDTSAMLELRDIYDELHTLQKLFSHQKDTLDQMLEIYKRPAYAHVSENGQSILRNAQEKLHEYTQQVEEMIESATRTRTDFEKLLDLKQRQANVDEARLARYQADLTSVQSRAVMVFTVFTVLFLPLTFFTGLFGMNISEWNNAQTTVSLTRVVQVSIPISVAIILSALALALSPRARLFARELGNIISGLISKCLGLVYIATAPVLNVFHLNTSLSDSRKQRIRARKKKKRRMSHKDMVYDDMDDFWEDDADRMKNEYHIPHHNRRRKNETPYKAQRKTTSETLKELGRGLSRKKTARVDT